MVQKLLHPVPAVLPIPVEPGEVGGIDQGHIPGLLPAHAIQQGRGLSQILRAHPAGGEFTAQGHQLLKKGRPPGGPGVYRQLGGRLPQGQLHEQQLPPRVQGSVRQMAGALQHPAGQLPEAQHLRVPGRSRAAHLAQVQL